MHVLVSHLFRHGLVVDLNSKIVELLLILRVLNRPIHEINPNHIPLAVLNGLILHPLHVLFLVLKGLIKPILVLIKKAQTRLLANDRLIMIGELQRIEPLIFGDGAVGFLVDDGHRPVLLELLGYLVEGFVWVADRVDGQRGLLQETGLEGLEVYCCAQGWQFYLRFLLD